MAGHFDDGPDDEVDQIKGGAVDKQKKPPPSALSARRGLCVSLRTKSRVYSSIRRIIGP